MMRWLRMGTLWIAAAAVAGGVAFLGVALALRQDGAPSTAAPHLQDARKVEDFAAELRSLLDEMGAPDPGREAIAIRINDIRPKVREKQQQILRAKLSGRSYTMLLTAVDRLAAFTARPRDAALYDAAHKAQSDLEAQVRAEIRRLENESRRERRR
jgi:hypothetical protein